MFILKRKAIHVWYWHYMIMSLVWDWMQHCCTARNSRQKKDFIPACLESLGLMQRTYDGSLDMRISMSLARLALNWVAAWGGRHQDTRVRNGETVRRRAAEPRGARDDGWRDWLPRGGWTLVSVWRTGNLRQSPVQAVCVRVCVWVRVCERRACKSHGIPQWVGISRDSPSDCPLRGSWEGNTLQLSVSGETAGFHSSHTHTLVQTASGISPSQVASCRSAHPCRNTASGSCSQTCTSPANTNTRDWARQTSWEPNRGRGRVKVTSFKFLKSRSLFLSKNPAAQKRKTELNLFLPDVTRERQSVSVIHHFQIKPDS